LGKCGSDGLYACHSQVTTLPNNLELLLQVLRPESKIDLRKSLTTVGFWTFGQLAQRLAEKHSRAAFVMARTQIVKSKTQFLYDQFVYCEKPSIERFVDLVVDRDIVFEFLMSEKSTAKIRNHGYPWRLSHSGLLDQLFTFQIQLR
jgi:hypothetical protein